MRTSSKINFLWALSLLCVILASPLQGEVIYDNSKNDLLARYSPGEVEIGDEILLDGTARFLTYFSFEWWGTSDDPNIFAGEVEARVRFYKNNGPDYHSPAGDFPTPGEVFYDSGWFGEFGPTPRATFIFTPGMDFPLGGLWIPVNRMTWSVQFRGMGLGDALGVDIYCPPVVGANPNDYWENDPVRGWRLLINPYAPNNQMNFAAYMEAVPEPSGMALLLLGGLGLMAQARRQRRKG